MTDPDLLPNGMRLGQRVRLRGGGRLGATVEGEVVGWQQNPTVVIRGADGENRHVIYRAEWEPLKDGDWIDSWSEDLELFYEFLSANGWAEHFHCGWDEGDDWRDPRAVDDGMGMCGKEWAEREGVVELAARAQQLPAVKR